MRPVVYGVRQSLPAGLASDNDKALSGPLGDGRVSRQTAPRGVVTSLQGIPGFCEQRGEDVPSHFRQGCEDFRVLLSKNRVEKVQGQFRMPFDNSV
jgi:hypothetical protein